jgi:hypothetical protein
MKRGQKERKTRELTCEERTERKKERKNDKKVNIWREDR